MTHRDRILEAIAELNETIDKPLIERGFDADGPDDGSPAEVAYVLTRTMKLAEELGELTSALTERLLLNFRKAGQQQATWFDVAKELNDVAATAVLANAALFNPTDPIADLEGHILYLRRRAREATR